MLVPVAVAMAVTLSGCTGDSSAIVLPPTTTIPPTSTTGVLSGAVLWVNPSSSARATSDAWRATRVADAAQMDKVAAAATALWIGDWNVNVQADVDAAATTMSKSGATPVFVAYNIPHRDCGGTSGGTATTADGYKVWITAFANGIGARRAAVVLEPDALAEMECLSPADQQIRFDLLNFAVQTLNAKGNISVYLDAGRPGWQGAALMASRLTSAGIASAQGFSLNVANFILTSDNVSYGAQISALVGGRHFIIDTSRNGLGPTADNQWCNPAGRALGPRPTTSTGVALVDAYLWIKSPGESDGTCNGGLPGGTWMPEYALGLAQRAAY